MARKKKYFSIEEELADLREQIVVCEEEIKRLTDRKKELEQLIEKKKMEALYQAMAKSGKSMKEVISLICESE